MSSIRLLLIAVFCVNLPTCHSLTLNVVWLSPSDVTFAGHVSSNIGAFELAVSAIKRNISERIEVKVEWVDSGCSSKSAVAAMYHVLVENPVPPDVILGPPCNEGQLAGYRELPIFGWLSASPAFSDKAKYNSLVRVIAPLNAVGESSPSATRHSTRTLCPQKCVIGLGKGLVRFLERMEWFHIFVVSSPGLVYWQLGQSVVDAAKEYKGSGRRFSVARWEQEVDVNETDDVYRNLAKEARSMNTATFSSPSSHPSSDPSSGPSSDRMRGGLPITRKCPSLPLVSSSRYRLILIFLILIFAILCVGREELRHWMLAATQHRLVGGDFVFIYIDSELATSEFYTLVKQASFWMKGDGSDVDMRKAYENLLMLSVKTETQEELKEFYRRADEAAAQSDWQRQFGVTATKSDVTSPFLHDAVLLYAKLAMEVFASGKNYNNGSVLVEHVKNKHYENKDGATGQMTLDENGDRDPFFWVFDLHQDGSFQVVAEVIHQYNNGQQQRVVKFVQDIIWGDKKVGFSNKPADVLICGFQGEKCPDYTVYVVTPTVSATVLIILVVSLFVYRKYRFEQSLHDMAWQIQYSDLKPKGQGHRDYTSSLKLQSAGSSRTSGRIRSLSGMVTRRSGHMTSCTSSLSRGSLDDHGQIFASTAVYRGMTVAVKTLRKASVRMSKKLLLEMKLMTVDLKNQNLAVFLGVTVETPNICEVWEYCPKGSLQDVIWNENIKLDDMFKFSMAIDIFKGLKYLHESELGCHGRLKSPNCVIDGRWVCKLTDYGLDHFRGGQYLDPEVTDHMKYSSKCLLFSYS
ncbi:Atrial natriuretic peptide receptor 1 [Lamellibrachia satsuma]|nr:Atrial natriuretic peptide receptor 1 [Lamellibrachia satsuma]